MTAVPRRLLILGGGPVGVEMAQAVRRLGGEVVVVDGAATWCSPASRHRWARRSVTSCAATASTWCSARTRPGVPATTTTWPSTTPPSCAVTRRRADAARVGIGIGLETVGIDGTPPASPWVAGEYGDRLWASATSPSGRRRQGPGRHRRRQHPRRAARADYEALPRVVFTDPQAAGPASSRRASQPVRCCSASQDRHLHAALRRVERLPDPPQRRHPPDGRLRARAGGGRVAAAGDVGHPRPRPLDVLRDTIQPFPTFSEIYADALKALRAEIAAAGS